MLLLASLTLLLTLASALPAVAVDEPSPAPSPLGTPVQPTATPAGPTPTPYAWPDGEPCPLPNPLPTPSAPGAAPQPLPLCPAPASDPLPWLFNPLFQTLFLGLVVFYRLAGDIGIAIILLTLVIKTILIPLFRRQIVSQRRMQLLQPEIRAIQQKFKGNRAKVSEETMRLYRERGINPAAGCLPAVLQLFLLIPIYSVISQGLGAPDISSALQFLGQPLPDLVQCQAPGDPSVPCIDPTVSWLGNLDAHVPEVLVPLPLPFFPQFGLSSLALVAAVLQLIQTRMMMPNTNDPQARAQQRIFLILPLFSIIYGAILPAGLFLYWIVFTGYSIVQQYFIAGWGSLFPLFGWHPAFARNHTPRFPVAQYTPPPQAESGESRKDEARRSPTDRAAGTIRPARSRGRTSRRGRRR